TPQCDIFSTGVVLHEMLTLRRLIRGNNVLERVKKLKTMIFPPPSAINADVGPDLDAVVCKALDRNLGVRYAAAADMVRDLDAIVQAERFSVEELGHFMRAVFPPEARTEPPQVVGAARSQVEPAPAASSAPSIAMLPTESSTMR